MNKMLMALLGSGAALMVAASPASAGGWAMSSLDELPAPIVGEHLEVGLTIRQHGVRPVNIEDVAIEVTNPSGAVERFSAAQQGATGHYVSSIVFREAGSASWLIRQGGFGDQPLGPIEVAPSAAAAAASDGATTNGSVRGTATSAGYRWPAALRIGLPILAIGLGTLALVDVTRSTRRRRPTGLAG